MMEAAGAAAASFIMRTIERRPVLVLCGPGNNGGDGYVIARKLKEAGWPVRVAAMAAQDALKGDARLMAGLWDGGVVSFTPPAIGDAGLIVDAIFGTGLAREISSDVRAMVEAANAHTAPIVAIDLPTGVDADTGAVLGVAIRAAATATFISKKPGHLLFPGRAYCGAVDVADIGVKGEWLSDLAPTHFENHLSLFAAALRRPSFGAHKFSRGAAAVMSGPRLKTGAARLAARAALRVGAGIVTLVAPKSAADEIAAHVTALMVREADDAAALADFLADPRVTACIIGPGAGADAATRAKTLAALDSQARCVLDADALTAFEANPAELYSHLRADDVLTPHGGEFARLFPSLKDEPRIIAARRAAEEAKAALVMKGADTIIAHPDGRAIINANAPADLATAGSGDVLAGLIGGLIAQGAPSFEAAAAGVFLHSAAAQIVGPGLIAEDLAEALPAVFRALYQPAQTANRPSDAKR